MATAPDYNQIYQQSLQQVQQANAPAIAAIGSQIPTYQAQQQAALGQLNAGSAEQVGNQQKVTSEEFGARGIPLSSGIFGQTLQNQIGTLSRYYNEQGQGINTNFANLISQAQAQQAAMQAQNTSQAQTNAYNLYGAQLQSYNDALSRAAEIQAAQIGAGPQYTLANIEAQRFNTELPTIQQALAATQPQNVALSQLNSVGNKDIYVDPNEANLVYRNLLARGISTSDAKNAINTAMQQAGLKRYGNWSNF